MKVFERFIFVAGLAIFSGFVYLIGPGSLLHDLALVGVGFVIVFGQESLAILFNTLGWHYAIPHARGRVAFGPLFAMRMAGDAINYATPSASIGGEFVKARLLHRKIPLLEAVSSVSLAAINQFLSEIIFILATIPFFATQALTPAIANITYAASGLIVLICVVLFYLAWRRNLFQQAHAFLVRRGWFRQWTEKEDVWRKLDENIFGSFWRHPRDNAVSVLFFTLGWAMGAVEVYLILYFFQVSIGWGTAFAIEGFSILIDMCFFYVPAKIGTQEGGKYIIFLLLGLNPESGFALGVVRRLREIAWTLLGFLAFGYYQYMGHRGDTLDPAARRVLTRPSGDLPP